MSSNNPSGGFSLFPNTSGGGATKPPSRKTTPRPRAGTPQSPSQGRGPSIEMTPPRNGRRTPVEDLSQFVIDGSPPPPASGPQMTSNNPYYQTHQAGPSVSRPVPPEHVPPRTDTAFSAASTLVRNPSGRSRSSIAKRPFEEEPESFPLPPEAGLRSIFPQYDHTLPFDRQDYYPTQTSPSHIPRMVISRQSHVPQQVEVDNRSPPVRSPVRSPLSAGSATTQQQQQRWPRRPQQEPPTTPAISTTEELRDYWKAASGWRAAGAEGRTFCMKLLPEPDAPVYHLTSASSQPLYHMRLDPTSASAYVTLSRHDPGKPCRERDPQQAAAAPRSSTGLLGALREADGGGSGSNSKKQRPWQEAIATTLEEPARRLPPHDGLVALLYPTAAAKVALDKPGDVAAVMAAERECARLVWDDDSGNYFLVHPALATPFCITVERSPAWSRTEYAVEHVESPRHLARLTRHHGAGDGWVELDSLVAGRVESYYILDVAVCALLLVAHLDEKNVLIEQFAPPPAAHLRSQSRSLSSPSPSHPNSQFDFNGPPTQHESSHHRSGSRLSSKKDKKKKSSGKRSRLEELELDLESQASSLGGKLSIKDKDREKLPGPARTAIKLLGFAFKCVIWSLTLAFKALMAVVVGLTRCLTSEKL
ncbi:Uu.00g033910.m01.CDS01 [Anthostomella pinea]|uniref:Uu.00g033910.m01.CDS01 n=1 Tax=Anthostomella pinea TaxID=933095 RepID=A0AAI8YDF9_9PEZI|nr:Uu.00g033910.m01.CDS01 [Anthostomella pinea]